MNSSQPLSLLSDIPSPLPDELLQPLFSGKQFRVERIVSQGHASSPGFWYDQEEHEWVLLLKGSAGLRFEKSETEIRLGPGDSLHIPARQRHRVEWTDGHETTIWLAIFYA